MPASGKSTIAKEVAKRYGLKYLCGGDVLKEMAIARGYRPSGEEWWDTEEGMKFLEERKVNQDFDREVDRRIVKSIEEGGVVVTSYTAPWLTKAGVKVWLKASAEARARRMADRDGVRYDMALQIVLKRDSENIALYRHIYGFELGEDLSVFDLIIDTENLSSGEVVEIVSHAVRYFI